MSSAQTLGSVVSVFGVVAAASPVLQIARVLQRRQSADISTVQLGIVVTATLLWLAYGFSINNTALVVANVVASSVNTTTLATVIYFKRRPNSEENRQNLS